jgi:hypothetical protein
MALRNRSDQKGCPHPALQSLENQSRFSVFWLIKKEVGYCWPTPKGRNLSVQDAFFEGKKAKETCPRKVLLEL